MISRRAFLAASTALAARPTWAVSPQAFAPAQIVDLARDLSTRAYRPRPNIPQDWIDLTYEQYRLIWPRPDAALWHGTDSPYEVDFFHPGLYFPQGVRIEAIEQGQAQPVPFSLDGFDRTDQWPTDLTMDDTLGFSGLRLRTELDQPGKRNEFCVFQGASYFRAIGIGDIFGLSARGIALRTGDPAGEEFPDFTRFWLERPAEGQNHMVLHALLNGPSLTGAYRFEIHPGQPCVMEVEATLFPRVDLDHVGLGPLTSMFLFDQTNRHRFDDFRPAVHDSDGLLMQNGAGEVIWRPLANPKTLQISAFMDENPRGFGLMQRARKLGDFADLEALYHLRPGLWVEPKEGWGKGSVSLVEIPADKEIYDNIVAYWRPADPIEAGSEHKMSYRLSWGSDELVDHGLPRVLNTAMGEHVFATGRLAVIDFEAHPMFDDGPEAITVHTQSPHADTTDGVLQRNPETGGLRLAFAFDPKDRDVVELRAQLRKDGQLASEVWLYRWTA